MTPTCWVPIRQRQPHEWRRITVLLSVFRLHPSSKVGCSQVGAMIMFSVSVLHKFSTKSGTLRVKNPASIGRTRNDVCFSEARVLFEVQLASSQREQQQRKRCRGYNRPEVSSLQDYSRSEREAHADREAVWLQRLRPCAQETRARVRQQRWGTMNSFTD